MNISSVGRILFPDLECAAEQWCLLPDQLTKCGFGCVIFVNDFQMLQLPAECLKTVLLGLGYKTKWMKYAQDKVVSLYLELFSVKKKRQHDSVVKLLSSNGRKIWMLLDWDTYINV